MLKSVSESRQKLGASGKPLLALFAAVSALGPTLVLGATSASAAQAPGVTATAIQVGLPYLDLESAQSGRTQPGPGKLFRCVQPLIDKPQRAWRYRRTKGHPVGGFRRIRPQPHRPPPRGLN